MIAIGRATALLALMLAAGSHPVSAQEVSPQACTGAKEMIQYLVNQGAFVQDAGVKETGVDLLANYKVLRNAACGTPDDDSYPPPVAAQPLPTPARAPTPVAAKPNPIPDIENSSTRRDACLLITEKEVGDAMKQGVVANESDPAGVDGAQGCEFNGVSVAYTDVMYFQANASFIYDAFHSTAEANGVQSVAGLGDRAFTYIGGNGPGVVVSKGDKVFTLEFSGIGNGTPERDSLLILAQQAVARVH
jgi:hypothetical protein